MEDLNEKILSDLLNQKIFALAKRLSISLYLAGGYLRDLFIGIEDADRDYVVEGRDAIGFAKRVASLLGGSFVELDPERDTSRVVLKDITLDFSGTLGKKIEDDLERRDFTVNSMAWSPERGFIDLLNGRKDIKERVIRAIKKEGFIDDPIRLLRAYRIGSETGMDIEPRTEEMISKLSHMLRWVSGERISSELFKILKTNAFNCILKASKTGVLDAIFPELTPIRDIPPHGVHPLGAFDHSIEVVRHIEDLLTEFSETVKDHLQEEISYDVNRFAVLKLGGLLHDIGKPLTFTIEPDGRQRFIGHERVGAELVEQISERLKLSINIKELLKTLVRWHLLPLHLTEEDILDRKALYRFYRALGNDSIDVTILAMADRLSIRGNKEGLVVVLEDYSFYKEKEIKMPRLLTGDEIMDILKIGPGPLIGEVLEELREAQFLGYVGSKEEAVVYLKRYKLNLT